MKRLHRLYSRRTMMIGVVIAFFSWFFISFDDNDDFELAKNLDIFHTLMRELRLYYVDDIKIARVFETGIDEMLETLDPYTVYYPESQIEDFRFITTGQYGGIGALMRSTGNDIIIEEVYEGYPADKAGFKPGDIIKRVGDQDAGNSNYDDISILMKGAPDTEIDIVVYRPFLDQTISKTLKRERIRIENVPYYGLLANSAGYIKLTGFTQTAYDEVKEAFGALKQQNASSLILDLRDNPGGLLIEAVKIVGLFVEKGTNVVNTKGKVKQWNQSFNTPFPPLDSQIPIIVLVNRNSASASEIIAGALQDLDRAVIIGERTYGKGLVQTTRDLSYNAKLKVTTAKYYIPSGRCIQALDYTHRNPDGSVGFIPDSLISEFKTANGRKVYDGGGVSPDISVKETEPVPVTSHLYQNLIIFDFATHYVSNHQNIGKPENFSLTEKEFEQFIDFALVRKIEYKTETEEMLDRLIETSKKEKYYSKANHEIDELKKKLTHSPREDMIYFKENIIPILSAEIIKRYYYHRGVIQYQIRNNEAVARALKLSKNEEEYQSFLESKD